jgi:ATP-binding cassette, subfamily B, bacterial
MRDAGPEGDSPAVPAPVGTGGLRNAGAGLRAAVSLCWQASAGPLLATVGLAAVTVALSLTGVWLTGALVDALTADGAGGPPIGVMLGLAAVGAVAAVQPHLTTYVHAEFGRRVGLATQDELYRSVQRQQGLRRFEDPEFLDRVRLAQMFGSGPVQSVVAALAVVAAGGTVAGLVMTLWTVSPVITAVVLAAAGPALAANLLLARRQTSTITGITPAQRRELFYGLLLVSPQAAKEIRLFGIGDFLRRRLLGERRSADAAQREFDRHTRRVQVGLALANAFVVAVGLIWAGHGAAVGRLSAGDVVMFLAATAAMQAALATATTEIARGHQALLMFEHYRSVRMMPSDLPATRRTVPMPTLRDGIQLRDVWFRYGPDRPWVLRGLDLNVPAGRTLGLVGRNGAGKSTIVKLLCRFYDPCHGAILWNGTDIREFPVDDLRHRMATVFQDYVQYDLTAAENIAVGDLASLDVPDRVEAAARHAGVHGELARLPRGYRTLLSRTLRQPGEDDDGAQLSGGQWQRIAVARALVRPAPDLLILDEPSSGLDAMAEYDIHAALREHHRGRTTVLISHRLGSMRHADSIAVVDGGVVAELGSHDALMARDGQYARLFVLQARGYGAPRQQGQPARSMC